MFLYLSSSDCLEYFPENDAVRFRIKLPKRIYFGEDYNRMALLDIKFPIFDDNQSTSHLTINSSLCRESYKATGPENILQRLYEEALIGDQKKRGVKNCIFEFNPVRYVPVNVLSTDIIDLYIKGSDGRDPPFVPGITECTLHFTKNHGV